MEQRKVEVRCGNVSLGSIIALVASKPDKDGVWGKIVNINETKFPIHTDPSNRKSLFAVIG